MKDPAFFILKKPAFIDFNTELCSNESSLKSRHQILFNGTDSNAKLVKMSNGKWYVKYGRNLLEMKEVICKPMGISQVEDGKGQILSN
jgi:hypothetical protein